MVQLDWSHLRPQENDALEKYSAAEVSTLNLAIEWLKNDLGTDFWQRYPSHPLLGYAINRAKWTRVWLATFARALQLAKQWKEGQGLLERIRNPDQFSEALSVLKAGIRFDSTWEVTVDPQIQKAGGPGKPDLKLFNSTTGEELFVELSALGP